MKTLLAALMVLSINFVPPTAARATVTCPTITAHRTDPLEAPENSVPGIMAAGATGADSVEFDVRNTKSHFAVLMHDVTVDRTTNGTGNVADKWLGDVTSLSAADYAPWNTDPRYAGFNPDGTPKVKVPYGWDIFNATQRADIDVVVHYLVVPTKEDADNLVDYMNRFTFGARTIIMGSEDVIKAWKTFYPQLTYVLIEYNPTNTIRRATSLASLGLYGYAVPERDITPANVSYWKTVPGLRIITWTTDNGVVDGPTTWQRVISAGADQLITNKPREAKALTSLCVSIPSSVR